MARTPITLPQATASKILNMQGLANYDAKIKDWVDEQIDALPEEQYLDQTNTVIVENFTWSASDYPGSTDPSLDGKPVLVFAVKNVGADPQTTAYSFINLNKLVDVYTGNAEGDTLKGIEVSVDENRKITAEAKLHVAGEGEATNLLEIAADGSLYVPTPAAFDSTAITGRLDDLEAIVGDEADTDKGTAATGLVKKVEDIETALGDGTAAGLKKDVADLKTTVGDSTSGLVKDVAANKTAIGDSTSGIIKDIADINTEIGVKADADASTAATGIYKYVDDAVGGVADELVYADATDIELLF